METGNHSFDLEADCDLEIESVSVRTDYLQKSWTVRVKNYAKKDFTAMVHSRIFFQGWDPLRYHHISSGLRVFQNRTTNDTKLSTPRIAARSPRPQPDCI